MNLSNLETVGAPTIEYVTLTAFVTNPAGIRYAWGTTQQQEPVMISAHVIADGSWQVGETHLCEIVTDPDKERRRVDRWRDAPTTHVEVPPPALEVVEEAPEEVVEEAPSTDTAWAFDELTRLGKIRNHALKAAMGTQIEMDEIKAAYPGHGYKGHRPDFFKEVFNVT